MKKQITKRLTFKRFTALLIITSVLLTIFSQLTVASANEAEVQLGHVRGGEKITIQDALEVLKFLAGIDTIIQEGNNAWKAAIITEGGTRPTINDVLAILKYLAGINGPLGIRQIVTREQLQAMGWIGVDEWFNDLNRTLIRFNITTLPRIRHFISQCGHESGLGRWKVEVASGEAYEGRLDLGNTQPGDGPLFKGAGFLQLTGRYNYQRFADFVPDPRVMEGHTYVAENYPWMSAGHWWHRNNMNIMIDGHVSSGAINNNNYLTFNGVQINESVNYVSRRVNGGTNHLDRRQALYAEAVKIFK